jgi:Protein of unknown function (DUF3489)
MNVFDPRTTREQRSKKMITYTINDENNITAYVSAEEAASAEATATTFDSEAALLEAAAEWPLGRFVEIWNGIPGNSKVKKFADRKKAVARIWNAIQSLAGHVQPPAAEPTKTAKLPKKAKPPKTAKPTKAAKPAKKSVSTKQTSDKLSERSNKKADVTAMMKRAKGVTLAQIMESTGWQKHTVRGFVSILGSKGGHTIESTKNSAGERTYRIAK